MIFSGSDRLLSNSIDLTLEFWGLGEALGLEVIGPLDVIGGLLAIVEGIGGSLALGRLLALVEGIGGPLALGGFERPEVVLELDSGVGSQAICLC